MGRELLDQRPGLSPRRRGGERSLCPARRLVVDRQADRRREQLGDPANPYRAARDLRARRSGWTRCGGPGESNRRRCSATAPAKWSHPTSRAHCRCRTPSGSSSTAARLLRRTVGQGSMLAAGISRAEAERLVARHPHDISIAAVNAPRSVTLSGNAAILAEIDKTLNDAGVFSRALQVEAPFHSPEGRSDRDRPRGMPARHHGRCRRRRRSSPPSPAPP